MPGDDSQRANYVQFLVGYGNTIALQAGAQGSAGYTASLTAYRNGLLNQIATVNTQIVAQGGGKYVSSVSVPGQSVTFSADMSLFDQVSALLEAFSILSGNVSIVRRTTARYY
jgi:hypothetical protein